MDLSLISLNRSLQEPIITSRTLQNAEVIPYLDDGTVDMGSSFDLFHEVSYHDTPLVSVEAIEYRNLLRSVMIEYGFKEYRKEWWHYTLLNEPYPNTYFNFTVQ